MTKKKEHKEKMGAPEFPYTEEMAERICHLVSTTPKGLTRICEENLDIPGKTTIYKWRNTIPSFADKYAKAKARQIDILVEDCNDISEDMSNDFYTGEKGHQVPNSVAVARAKLIVDTRKWYAARLAPKLYGDRMVTENHLIPHENGLKELDK